MLVVEALIGMCIALQPAVDCDVFGHAPAILSMVTAFALLDGVAASVLDVRHIKAHLKSSVHADARCDASIGTTV
jgi:hypothetical protein